MSSHVHDVVGRVLGHQQLLEDDLALGVDLVRPERRPRDDVAEQVEAEGQLRRRAGACSTPCAPAW